MKSHSYPLIGGAAYIADQAPAPVGIPTDLPRSLVAFDTDAFDTAIRGHGVKMLHYRAMRCPIGMIDPTDVRKQHEEHAGCSHGFLYTFAGEIQGIFSGNSANERQSTGVMTDDSTVSLTPPRFYEDGTTPFFAARYDRLYLAHEGIYVPTWETFMASADGIDKLNFPVEFVQDLVDADGIRYQSGSDFVVEKGRIKWIGARPASPDPRTGRSPVCGVRYLYRPYWYVSRIPHELRIARADGPDGSVAVQRMPQSLMLQREWLFESELPTSTDSALAPPVSDRQPPGPPRGSFGAR